MEKQNVFGSTLIVAGTAFGAGMLALPMVTSATTFLSASIILITTWALMAYTALLILEVTLAFERRKNNFISMASKTLGFSGKAITWLGFLLLLYSLTAAYIAGDASLLLTLMESVFNITLPSWVYASIFTLAFGICVFWSTQVVDIVNRSFLSLKTGLLFATLVMLMPYIDFTKLDRPPGSFGFIWASLPIIICAFGFHHIIPSLTNYIGKDPKKLKKIIIIGSLIPLFIYLCWIFASFSIVPLYGKNSFFLLNRSEGSVGEFIQLIIGITDNRFVKLFINGFSNIAMTTSFLGVTLGLFDFLADGFNIPNTRSGRAKTAMLTFIPPLIFAIFYPDGFIFALGYAGVFAAILLIILPALMVMKLRREGSLESPYKTFGGHILPIVTIFIGVGIILIQVLNNIGLLPIFGK